MQIRSLLLAAALVAAAVPPLQAQVRASEKGMVSQVVDGTTISLEYHRPVARGRDSLFGGVVDWDKVWTPGANWATTLEVDRDVQINGHALPAGKYSVWMVPKKEGPWTVRLSREARRFHTQRPGEEHDQLRFEVEPERGEHMEALTWYFPAVSRVGASLRMHWGDTVVPLRIGVEPTKTVALSAAERAPYHGAYRLRFAGAPDSVPGVRLEVFEREEMLQARIEPSFSHEGDPRLDLIPAAGEHRFHFRSYRDGEIWEVNPETVLLFVLENGRAERVELWGMGGRKTGEGERIP